ncbi:hypothetical protein [Kangiella shandongensis]|uniref:hypothetical protein n=1 Tax=Kangiella shandongensis TaxID=2763258 RepID=UPI001CBE9ADC|nr:hypothetical protein [Kangiella shandongensis]
MKNSRFVLISETGYQSEHDEILKAVLERGFELFCAVGKDCELWEEVMDELAVGDGIDSRYITTTSHPGESEEEVIEFAKSWIGEGESGIEIVRI